MCGNCWTETGDQSIYFSHVYWETTYKLRLYLSCNSSQVWPTRISGVIESVFRCSGPNSKSIVTLTRPMQRKNAPLLLLPPFCSIAATGDFYIDYRETKISSKSTIIETNADKCSQCQTHKDLKFSVSDSDPVHTWPLFNLGFIAESIQLIKTYRKYPILSIFKIK